MGLNCRVVAMKVYDILVLGGGASGLMFSSCVDKKYSIAIVEANSKVAQKLRASGGGRCNFTNTKLDLSHYDNQNIEYFLDRFSNEDLLKFLSPIEIELKKDRHYFCKNSSEDIISHLKQKSKNVEFLLNREIFWVRKRDDKFVVGTQKGELYASKLVVATGAKSYASLGATDIALKIASDFDIKTKAFSPALVGLTLQPQEFWMRELSGLSCNVAISIDDKKITEDMLFTHKGISGPAVMSASLYWQKGNISIDFLPTLSLESLLGEPKKLLSSILPLPKRLILALLKALDIENKKVGEISKVTLEKLKNYTFAPAGNFGFSKAEVCRGGVLLSELDNYTLEALNVKGLYFIGEAVDVTGELGGYNIQWAFSSAYVCASSF